MLEKRKILIYLFLLFSTQLLATTELQFTVHTGNVSAQNNDCFAEISDIQNGQAPYTFQWSKKDIPLTSNKAYDLHEGTEYTIKVSDALGSTTTKTFIIPPSSSTEKINHFFGSMVDIIASVLMVDIFALLHMYDPIIYDTQGNPLLHPNGSPKQTNIPLIVVWLFLGALYFTLRFKFINIHGFIHSIHLVRGKYDKPEDKGQLSHFQALATALSATVGLGNIAGVALAIGIGGPGATFWMILMGILGMSSKFTEAALGVKYRRINKNGEVSGGPMYYLQYVFGTRTYIRKKMGKALAIFFAILLIGSSLGGGNMFQANQSFSNIAQMIPSLQNHSILFGFGLAFLVGIVILGGITSIAKVTSKIVPIMAGIYLITGLIIIFSNFSHIETVAKAIYNGAFHASSVYGGLIGVMVMGIQRAAFSNEAGIGSAAIAHSTVKTQKPVSEGFVALLEPFIDTVVICSLTAFVLIFTGYYSPEITAQFQGANLTSEAFGSVFPWFKWVLLITILLFAYSTLISWSYYGIKGFDFLFGSLCEKLFNNRSIAEKAYKILFLSFIIVGTASSNSNVVDFSDMMLLCMAFPNMIGLVVFAPRLQKDLQKYWMQVKNKTLTSNSK
ncbi:MAG: Amino-acid carrier protein AlsT [Bacteroidetes bacterium ADurb.Bin217]|nr:MAG: Amino-acid carrier protein AlsT [Bacteroidetes bacterium ADurb.Bin217]